MRKLFTLIFLVVSIGLQAQVITADPTFVTDNDAVTITFYATEGSGGLAGYTGDVYAHTGVITENSSSGSDWKYVVSDWGENLPETKLVRMAPDVYTLSITPDIRSYYGVPASEEILQLAFVFRSAAPVGGAYLEGKTAENGDIFYELYQGGLSVTIISPEAPQLLLEPDESLEIVVASVDAENTSLFVNGQLVAETSSSVLNHTIPAGSTGSNLVKAIATAGNEMVADSFMYFVRPAVPVASLPTGLQNGINYLSDTSAALVLQAPFKEYVFVIGDFSNWQLDATNYMYRTPDGQHYWIEITSLEPGREYAYQYFVDGELRIADPYTNKVLDPWNDRYIPSSTYPDLMPYPEGKTSGIVSVFQTARPEYDWTVTDFEKPAPEDLVIYELHIRDFVETRAIKTVMDTLDYLQRLGVNAIELMPVNEFEGNDSWGYNPSFYFATDKAYGTTEDYKRFIDACHQRGIAVILDMVLNHSYGQSPLVQLYFDANAGDYGQPTAENPWYNQVCPHQPYCWGYDFDHESEYTKAFIDRVNRFWIDEFKVDGFRFDFTKGFSNVNGDGWAYNSQRIAILKRMADEIWETDPETYVILEHFADNSEEKELSNYGMMLWGNLNYNYNEATMGWLPNSNFSGVSYKQRGWSQPHLVGYMESHDEERQMYKNITFGNQSNPSHDVRELNVAVKRNAAAAAMFLLVPGPKMIWQFGELGYDVSIDYECRVCPKPVLWNYQQNWDRRLLYNYYSALIDLRKSHPVFRTDDFSLDAGGAAKVLKLRDEDMSVIVVANFDVNEMEKAPGFYETGIWYDYFSGEALEVTDTQQTIVLAAGEFKVFTTKQLDTPGFVGLDDLNSSASAALKLYPNPVSDELVVRFALQQTTIASLKLFNITGQEVLHYEYGGMPATTQELKLNVSNVIPGIYLLQLQQGDQISQTKVIVQ
ncbi:MAG: alpha-amylase family glycosyl hydrolase [Bacteroidales bacterium]|nr:alpha-amylase family glycosyl hydrolase [Bacteroidales bacterium]